MSPEREPGRKNNLLKRILSLFSGVKTSESKSFEYSYRPNPRAFEISSQEDCVKLPYGSEETYTSQLLVLRNNTGRYFKIVHEPIIILRQDGNNATVPDFGITFTNGVTIYVEVTSAKGSKNRKHVAVRESRIVDFQKAGLGDKFLFVEGKALRKADRVNSDQEMAELLLGKFASFI